MRKAHSLQLLAIAAYIAALFFVYSQFQPKMAFSNGIAWDAFYYYSLSKQVVDSQLPVEGEKPFVYRVATPYLVAWTFPDNLVDGYLIYNSAFNFLAILAFYFFARLLVKNFWLAALLVSLYALHPQGMRFTFFYPVYVDPAAILISVMILYVGVARFPLKLTDVVLISILSGVGVLFREIVILSPLAVLTAHLWFRKKNDFRPLLLILPVIVGAAVILYLNINIAATHSEYSFYSAAISSAQENIKNPLRYLAAIIFTLGPVVVASLVFYKYGESSYPEVLLSAYLFIVLALSFIGGWHTDRFVFWGFFAYLLLAGMLLQRFYRDAKVAGWGKVLLSFLIILPQLFAYRAFSKIPDMDSINLSLPIVEDYIEYVLFSAYGQKITVLYTYAVGMSDKLRLQIIAQYAILMFLVSAIYLWASRLGSRRINSGI